MNLYRQYRKFIKPDIQKKKYRKIAKMFFAIIKFILFKKPYVLIVETGTICNLNCPTCPTPREIIVGARNAENMEFQNFQKLINNAYRSFCAVLLYWSNEPILNEDLVEMVKYCNEMNLYTSISTNVVLLTAEKFFELSEAGLDELLVCIDGFSPETYETFRKGAKFKTVKTTIEEICRLKKNSKAVNPWIEIQYIETKQNDSEIVSCKKWAEKIGIDGFRLQSLYIAKHLSDFEKLRDEFYTKKNWSELGKKNFQKNIKACKNPDSTVCVLVNGEATVCCYDIKGIYSYGDLTENSFKSITKERKYLTIKKKGKNRELSICREC